MLTHPLAERLRALSMAAMADAFLEMQNSSAAADLSREDWLGLLLDREVTARDNQRLSRRLRQAKLRQNAVVEDTAAVPTSTTSTPIETGLPIWLVVAMRGATSWSASSGRNCRRCRHGAPPTMTRPVLW